MKNIKEGTSSKIGSLDIFNDPYYNKERQIYKYVTLVDRDGNTLYDFCYINPTTKTIIMIEGSQIRLINNKYNLSIEDSIFEGTTSIYIGNKSLCHIRTYPSINFPSTNQSEYIIGKHNLEYPLFENKIKIVHDHNNNKTEMYIGKDEMLIHNDNNNDYNNVIANITNNVCYGIPFIYMSDLEYIMNDKELRECLSLQNDFELFESIVRFLIKEIPDRLIRENDKIQFGKIWKLFEYNLF